MEQGTVGAFASISRRVFSLREAPHVSFLKWVGTANAIGWRVEFTSLTENTIYCYTSAFNINWLIYHHTFLLKPILVNAFVKLPRNFQSVPRGNIDVSPAFDKSASRNCQSCWMINARSNRKSLTLCRIVYRDRLFLSTATNEHGNRQPDTKGFTHINLHFIQILCRA